jgi:UDP-glucose 4-epimerase
MAQVWITGAHGFIGRYLAYWLAKQGHTVAGVGHGAWPVAEAARWGVSYWLNGEISASNLGQMQCSLGLPDVIFHLAGGSSVGAAMANPHEDFTRTVVTTAELLEWLRQHSPVTRLVAVSSAAVYGSAYSGPIPETSRLSPFSPYGAHKLIMEELCRSYADNFGLKVTLPRLFSVYGPELKKQLLWDLCCKLAKGGLVELGGTGNELRDWTNINDVVRAIEQTAGLANDKALVLNIATGIATSIREIASSVVSHWEGTAVVERIRFTGRSRAGDPLSLVADIEQMRANNIECSTPVDSGIAEYVSWYKSTILEAR